MKSEVQQVAIGSFFGALIGICLSIHWLGNAWLVLLGGLIGAISGFVFCAPKEVVKEFWCGWREWILDFGKPSFGGLINDLKFFSRLVIVFCYFAPLLFFIPVYIATFVDSLCGSGAALLVLFFLLILLGLFMARAAAEKVDTNFVLTWCCSRGAWYFLMILNADELKNDLACWRKDGHVFSLKRFFHLCFLSVIVVIWPVASIIEGIVIFPDIALSIFLKLAVTKRIAAMIGALSGWLVWLSFGHNDPTSAITCSVIGAFAGVGVRVLRYRLDKGRWPQWQTVKLHSF